MVDSEPSLPWVIAFSMVTISSPSTSPTMTRLGFIRKDRRTSSAMVIAPWLMVRFARKTLAEGHGHEQEGRVSRLYRRVAGRVIATRRSAWTFLIAVGVATLLACVLFATRTVTVKLLPFDNKSELQVVADLPEGSSLEQTQRVLAGAARVASALPEVVEIYRLAGETDYLLKVMVSDIAAYDRFYKRLIATAPLDDVSSAFAMEQIKFTTALPL